MYGAGLLPILFLPLIMGWARVKVKKHTPQEAFLGGFLGAVLTIIVYVTVKILSF